MFSYLDITLNNQVTKIELITTDEERKTYGNNGRAKMWTKIYITLKKSICSPSPIIYTSLGQLTPKVILRTRASPYNHLSDVVRKVQGQFRISMKRNII